MLEAQPTFLKDLVCCIYLLFLPVCVSVCRCCESIEPQKEKRERKKKKKTSDCSHQESRPERTAGVQSLV